MSEHLLIKILLDMYNTKLGDSIIANFLTSPRKFPKVCGLQVRKG